jgi:DNA-directed RNA polymerase subunit RPC12/RpoP
VRKVNKTLLTGMLRGIGPEGVEFTVNTGAAFTYPLNTVQVVRLVDGTWSFSPKTGELADAVKSARSRFPETKPAAAATAGAGNAGAGAAGAGVGAHGGGRQIPFTSLPNPNPAFGGNPSGAHSPPTASSLPTTLPSMAHTPSQPSNPSANPGFPTGGARYTPPAAHAPAAPAMPAMPTWTYEYSCSKCGHRWESQNANEHLTGSCPKCGLRGRMNQSGASQGPGNANGGTSTFRIPRGSVRVVFFGCMLLFGGIAGLVRWLNTGYYDRPHAEEEEEDKYRPKRRRKSYDD